MMSLTYRGERRLDMLVGVGDQLFHTGEKVGHDHLERCSYMSLTYLTFSFVHLTKLTNICTLQDPDLHTCSCTDLSRAKQKSFTLWAAAALTLRFLLLFIEMKR